MPKKVIALFILSVFYAPFHCFSQDLPLGRWRDLLPYLQVKQVVNTPTRIYSATEQSLFFINKEDNSIERFSKVNGLSDVGIRLMDYSESQNVVVVCYNNSNIDLIAGDKIINVSDIKRRTTTGDKTIFGITFNGKFAYLATGFGVIALDLAKAEIKDTYVIGPTGNETKVFAVTTDENSLFASTDAGILRGDLNNPNLNNFAVWTNIYPESSATTAITQLQYVSSKIVVTLAYDYNTGSQKDTVTVIDGNTYAFISNLDGGFVSRRIKKSNNKFYLINSYSIKEWDETLQGSFRFISNSANYTDLDLYDVVADNSLLYIADRNNGLVKYTDDTNLEKIVPAGPLYGTASSLYHDGQNLFVTHSPNRWNDDYSIDGFSVLNKGSWKTYNKKTLPQSTIDLSKMQGVQAIISDPNDHSHVFVGSRVSGLFEFKNGEPVTFFNATNSSLQTAFGNPGQTKVGGLYYDANGNLLVSNSGSASPMCRFNRDGTWEAFSVTSIVPNNVDFFYGDILEDSYGQIWINLLRTGLVVYDPVQQKGALLKSESGKGNLPSGDVRTMVEDKDGQIWVGTSLGVAVIYSPTGVLNGSNSDAQQILITIDGVTQYLLSSEIVTTIAIDGANRKWFGTQNGGVFLLSADGTKLIRNFNIDNSPLLSNQITGIAIDPVTGEVFFGTSSGLVSYVSDATEGETACESLKVFPNPVKENYSGSIAIRGVTANGNVKITDVAGNIVYETKANGGIAIWNGNSFEGKRVQTGVYLVFATDEKGDNTCTTKLVLVN